MGKGKSLLHSAYRYMEGINGILLTVYVFIICAIHMFMYHFGDRVFPGNEHFAVFHVHALLLLCALIWISPFILRKTGSLRIMQEDIAEKKITDIDLAVFLISFGILLIWYAGYYPGCFHWDSFDQYEQAISGDYNDWHPALHTLLSFTLPLKLTGGWIGSIVFFQITAVAAALTYLCDALLHHANTKFTVAILLWILLNPFVGVVTMYPWKDVPFGIISLFAMTCAYRIYCTDGKWLDTRRNTVFFALALAAATIIRNNGILFTLPLFAAVCFFIRRKKRIHTAVIFLALILLVKGPLYATLDVEPPGYRQTEMLGLPMTVIGNVVSEHPEVLNEEEKELVYAIASEKEWDNVYVQGSFNHIKWRHMDKEKVMLDEWDAIEEKGAGFVLKTMLHCFREAPLSSLKALFALTECVYSIDGPHSSYIYGEVYENKNDIDWNGNGSIRSFLEKYSGYVYDSILNYLFCYTGIIILVMLACILGRTDFRSKADWKRLSLCLPIFIYDFGTMLLLSTWDYRLFFVNYLIWPLALAIMMREERKDA